MSEIPQQTYSPTSYSNFIIAYHNELDLRNTFQNEGLLDFIKENPCVVTEVDSSFFPRAVTDLYIEIDSLAEGRNIKKSSKQEQTRSDNQSSKPEMDGYEFPPDVITSNSHQRSGPDGSPALCPPTSQGFVNASNLSETGELFAPVRTLTFSDVESSHVEDSYVNNSRLVSTPEGTRTTVGQFDYLSAQNAGNETNIRTLIDNRNDEYSDDSRENSPAFRQLDGEDENKLQGTGIFRPTFHGIDQEFLDNFTGKTRSSTSLAGDIFSPLNGGARVDENTERQTPPLHSPAPNSPCVKQLANQGVVLTRHIEEESDEIQFQMSPTHDPFSSQPFKSMSDCNYLKKHSMLMNTFQPIDKGQQSFMSHRHVPRNLSDYLEHVTDEQREYFQRLDRNYRQGDGTEITNESQTNQNPGNSPFDRQFSSISQEDFEARYLRKTQVSVKLPHPMYDTMSGEFVNQDSVRQEPAGIIPELHQHISDATSEDEHTNDGAITQIVTSNPKETNSNLQPNSYSYGTETKQNMTAKGNRIESNPNALKTVIDGPKMMTNSVIRSENDKWNNQTDACMTKPYSTQNSEMIMTSASKATTTLSSNKFTVTNSNHPSVSHSSFQPSSRLMQETISQRNKTNQKYVSNMPGIAKQNNNQSKDLKKTGDYQIKQSGTGVVFVGKKLSQTETVNNTVKLKPTDKQKIKSSEPLNQRQFKVSLNAGRVLPAQSQSQNRQDNRFSNHSDNHLHLNSSREKAVEGCGERVHNISGQSVDDLHEAKVVTQVQSTSPVHVNKEQAAFSESVEVQGMEDVRQQLQNMLKLSTATMSPHERSQYEHSEILAGFGVDYSGVPAAPVQPPVDFSWTMYRKPNGDEMVENFPSFTSQFMADSGNVSRSDVSLHTENQRLREMLEKERYRRKHCEQYIQQLNVKILEMQQQLAVAVSTDKRKDLMIEQLDKQLALVVEGWRKRDAEKDELVGSLQQEKEEVENTLQKQQQMINQFEHDMSEAVEALRQEREKAAVATGEMKEKIAETERAKTHNEELLSAEQEKCGLIEKECENLREARDTMDKKLEQMQRRLHRDQDEWFQREQELLQRIEEVGEKNAKILQMEKAKFEEQGKLAEEVVEQLQVANNTVKRLEMELEAAMREKESTKVEMGIMEAKFENAQRVLETDLQAQMEKQISEQIQDVQIRYERVQDEMREKHKVQVLELSQRHNKETEKQLGVFRDELAKKEEDFRRQLQELETRLLEYRNENSELKLAKQKLESTRLEILTKLQYAMQTQWNEALSLLAATPQRKNANSTLTPEDEGNTTSTSTTLSLSSVNFNLPARSQSSDFSGRTAPGLRSSESVEREQTDQIAGASSSDKKLTNQNGGISSQDRQQGSQNELFDSHESPTRDSVQQRTGTGVQQRTVNEGDNSVRVENATLSHMKDFQEYMNRLAETPEWISALTRQSQDSDAQKPVPQDISLLLSTYLSQQPLDFSSQSKQDSQHSHPESSNQNVSSMSRRPHPFHIESSSQLPFSSYSNTSSHIEVIKQKSSQGNHQHRSDSSPSRSVELDIIESVTPPREMRLPVHQPSFSESQFVHNHSNGVLFGGMVQSSSPLYEDTGMSRAVALRPPQQGDDPYLHDDNESVISSIAGGQAGGYFHGGQCFSPPTRQRRASLNNSTEDLNRHSNRLNEDYSDLSERMKKHETHQNDLQKYIQMLLSKPQSESGGSKNDSLNGQNESVLSQEVLDLNDTAQAAQLQKEFDRIQELRERQQFSSKSPSKQSENSLHLRESRVQDKHQFDVQDSSEAKSKILNEDQLGEITRLLNAVKDQPSSGNQHIGQLLNVLKDVQKDRGQQHDTKAKGNAEKPRPVTTGTKKNTQFNPSKPGVDGKKSQTDSNPQPAPRSAQSKKIERKIAGSATKSDKSAKPAAWK